MITIIQEEKVRKLLDLGISDSQIAHEAGVSRKAVIWIRKMVNLLRDVSDLQKEEVRRWLLAGLPVGAIEIRTRISRNKIVAIRRYYFLHKREFGNAKPHKCPTCGSIMLMKKSISNDNKKVEARFVKSDASRSSLCRIIEDIAELNNLKLITNPLFYDLAQRAEQTLEKINDKKTAQNK